MDWEWLLKGERFRDTCEYVAVLSGGYGHDVVVKIKYYWYVSRCTLYPS